MASAETSTLPYRVVGFKERCVLHFILPTLQAPVRAHVKQLGVVAQPREVAHQFVAPERQAHTSAQYHKRPVTYGYPECPCAFTSIRGL